MLERAKSIPPSSESKDIFDILQFKFRHSKSEIEQQIINFQKNYYRQYSTVDQTTLATYISDTSIKDALIKIGFPVPYDSNIISTIKNSITSNPQTISDIFIFGTFIQSLAYVISTEKPQEATSNLFKIFPILLPNAQYRSKIITVFIILLHEYSNSPQNAITDEIHSTILTFIKNCEELPATFSESFFLYMKKVSKIENQKRKLIGDLFDLTIQLLTNKKIFVSISDDRTFYEIIEPFILKLHIKAISLLNAIALSNKNYSKNTSNLFLIMAKGLCKKIKQKDIESKTVFIDQNLTEFPPLRELNEIKYDTVFKNMPDFKYDENEVKNLLKFDDNFQISLNFTPQSIQNDLRLVSSCLIGINDQYINVFLKRIMKSAENPNHLMFYADYFSAIVYIADIIKNDFDERIVRFLMSTIIFHSSKFSSFMIDNNNNKYYYYLRHSVFSLLVRQEKSKNLLINNLLIFGAKNSPFIYSEIVLFILNSLKSFDHLTVFCIEKQVRSFMSVSIELQNLYAKNEIDMNSCRLARIICFDFLFKLFDNHDSFLMIASTHNFSKGIVNFIFEPSLSDLFIDKFESLFIQFPVNLKKPPFLTISTVLPNIFDSCAINAENIAYKNLGIKIIHSIFRIIRKNPNFVIVFYPNFVYLLKFFRKSQEIELIDEIFYFLLLSVNAIENMKIDHEIFDILVEILNNVLIEKNEFSEKTKLNFCKLLSGKELNTADQFLIKYPQIIPLFITCFSKYKEFNDILIIFSNICDYSQNNCSACNVGDLDYFLIHLMKKEPEFTYCGHHIKFTFDIQKSYPKIVEIIEKVIRVKTSVFICDQLFQMLIPSSPSYQYHEVENNLMMINNIVKENLDELKPIYNLITNKTLCKINGFDDRFLNDDFAFAFKLKIDVPQIMEIPDEYTIALFQGVENTQYRIYLQSKYLHIMISKNNDEVKNTKTIELKNNTWTLITLEQKKIEQDKPEFIMKFSVDDVKVKQFRTTLFQFSPGKVSITLGISNSSSKKYANLKIGEIGPFFFGKRIDTNELKNDKNFESLKDIYFSSAQLINDKLHFDFRIKFLKESKCRKHFKDVLIDFYDLNYLTYIFSKFQTDNYMHLSVFVDIILSLLTSSKFAQNNYRSILFLEQAIENLFGRHLNYDLFLKFFSYLEQLSNSKLINNFFDCFIFNMNLWCLADSTSIINIIQHLKRDLNGHFNSLFHHSCKISKLLSIYRLSFFPESTTNEINEDESIYPFYLYHSPQELKLIKEEFFQFIVKKGQISLNCQDIQNIYSHLFASHNKSEKNDILTLISQLSHSISGVKNIQFDLISPLFKLLNSNDITIIINTIMTIKNISFDKVHLYFSVISLTLSQYSNVSALFDKLLNKVTIESDLYSLICALSLLMGKKKMQSAVALLQKISSNDLKHHLALDESCFWAIWPICIALRGSKSQRMIVADFLCKQLIRFGDLIHHFTNIYCLIEFLAQHDKSAAYYTQNAFTTQVLNTIFTTTRADIELHKLEFLILSFSSIFFYPQYFRNRPLNNLFLRSQFRDGFLQVKRSQKVNYNNNNNEISSDATSANNDEVEQIQRRRRNFDDFYYSWNPSKNDKQLWFDKKYAHDYSGIRIKDKESYSSDYRTQSDETKAPRFKYLLNSDKEEDDDDENERKDDDPGNKKPCKSFRRLLVNKYPPSLAKQGLIFQMKISDNGNWVDSELCDSLVEYSKQFLDQNPNFNQNPLFELIIKFIKIVKYMKNRNIENNMDKYKDLEDSITLIQQKLNSRLDSDKLFDLLKKAIEKAIFVMKYDNNEFFNSVDDIYTNNFTNEINRINDERNLLSDNIRFIRKNFIQCRDSSIFINRNKKITKTSSNNDSNFNINDENNNNNNSEIASKVNNNRIFSYLDKNRSFIYKRDNCLCYGFCPIKLRPKYINVDDGVRLLNVQKILQKVGCKFDFQDDQDKKDSIESLLKSYKDDEEELQNENEFNCKIIKIKNEQQSKLCFLIDQISIMIYNTRKIITIYYRLVRNIFRRKRYQKNTAFEIVLINGKSYLIDFEKEKICKKFADKIQTITFPLAKTIIFDEPIKFMENNRRITKMWENGFISNFSYLLTLNMVGGRSFNDVTQYPIFPLLIDNIQPKIDSSLTDTNSQTRIEISKLNEEFDDNDDDDDESDSDDDNKSSTTKAKLKSSLTVSHSDFAISSSLLIAPSNSSQSDVALTSSQSEAEVDKIENKNSKLNKKKKESRILKKFGIQIRDLSKNIQFEENTIGTNEDKEFDEINSEIDSMFNTSPLPPDIIDRFMMRIEPFTTLHLNKQNHQFNKKTIINNIESINEEKTEIIPEFFYFPEFLMNLNQLSIDEFSIPKFKSSIQNSFEFIYRHRKILETKKVSKDLNEWIDSIFGNKQKEFNYHPAIFESIWQSETSSLTTAEEEIKSMMKLYGVMPSQIFKSEHSKRQLKSNFSSLLFQLPKQSIQQHQITHHRTTSSRLPDPPLLPSSLPYRNKIFQTFNLYKKTVKKVNESPQLFSSSSSNSLDLSKYNDIKETSTSTTSTSNNYNQEEKTNNKKEIFKHKLKNEAMIHLSCSTTRNEFFVIDEEGNSFYIEINKKLDKRYELSEEKIDSKEKIFWSTVTHLCLIEGGYVIASSKSDDVFVAKHLENLEEMILPSMNKDIDFIHGSQNYFIIVRNGTIITVFDTISQEKEGEIVSNESKIVDCKIDQTFGLIVFLSSNDILHIHSLQNMNQIKAIDLNDFHPRQFLITSRWGFILVECLNCLILYDVNGMFIKRIEKDYSIKYWTSIRCYKDFDYVVFENDREEIGIFEAFNPSTTLQILTQVNSPVCSIDFFKEQNYICVLTKHSELIIISNYFSRF